MKTKAPVKIAPSILSADFARLGAHITEAAEGGADYIHVDVMDGHFVPNITIGPVIVEAIRPVTKLPLDVHLMIENPDRYLADFARAGSDTITVQLEACPHLHRVVQAIKELKVKAGVSLNPATPLGPSRHSDRSRPGPDHDREPGFRRAGIHPEFDPEIARFAKDDCGNGSDLRSGSRWWNQSENRGRGG